MKKAFVWRVLSLMLAAMMLCSCAKTNKFIMNGSSFRDKKTDVTYLDAPSSIEAITVSDREYGKSGDILFMRSRDWILCNTFASNRERYSTPKDSPSPPSPR